MSRAQKPKKTIEEYVHALRQLARDCEFQNVNAATVLMKMNLEEMLL